MNETIAPVEQNGPEGQEEMVKYSSFQKAVKESKNAKEKARELENKLKEFEKAEADRLQAKELEEGKYKEVISKLEISLSEKDTKLSELEEVKTQYESYLEAQKVKIAKEKENIFNELSPELKSKYAEKYQEIDIEILRDLKVLKPTKEDKSVEIDKPMTPEEERKYLFSQMVK